MTSTDFVRAALDDRPLAESLLASEPQLAVHDFHSALVSGSSAFVKRAREQSSELAQGKGGPRQWEPLLYLCFSRLATGGSQHATAFAETARVLLAHGADPNSFCVDEPGTNHPLSCLYAAVGLNNNPELARVLLGAGARPDDNESLYHSAEHSDLVCLRLLLQYGASPAKTNALKHMLDYESAEGVRLLLAAGADPNERNERNETALHWAVWGGRSAEIVTALLDWGAEIDAKRDGGRTAYALAVRSGQNETARLLEQRGAKTDMPVLDRFVGQCAAAKDDNELRQLLEHPPELPAPVEYNRLLPEFAANHCSKAAKALLAMGVPVDTRGDLGGTALHWACWKGAADIVKLAIDNGASLTIKDTTFHATPAGWFTHGLANCGERGRDDYPQVARHLLAAGACFPPNDIPTGDPAVNSVLREHNLI